MTARSLEALFREVYGDPAAPEARPNIEAADFYSLALDHPAVAWINAEGIDVDLLTAFSGIAATIRCRFEADRFALDLDKGEPSVVIEVLDADQITPIDLVAWPVAEPLRFSTSCGAAAVLGGWNIAPHSWAIGGALHLHRTPLAWLKAGCDGCVILNYRRARFELADALGPIIAEDAAHALELRRWLSRPALEPAQILFPDLEAAA